MFRICLSLFLTGIFLGAGPCLVSCGPFLISFISGTNKGFKESLWIWLTFSLARLSSYLILGLLAGFFSQEIVYRLYQGNFSQYLLVAGGIFVSFLGSVMFFKGAANQWKICQRLEEKFIKRGLKSTVFFGLFIGFLPCAPLLAILSYVALISGTWYKGIMYSLSFGLGTLISPLIILVLIASLIPKFLDKTKFLTIFQRFCGLIIVLLGLELIIRAF